MGKDSPPDTNDAHTQRSEELATFLSDNDCMHIFNCIIL